MRRTDCEKWANFKRTDGEGLEISSRSNDWGSPLITYPNERRKKKRVIESKKIFSGGASINN